MQKILISKEQLHDLVMNNRYKVEQKTQYISRCIDGRYQNKEDLPPLAIPGADAGELALILATGNIYGFEVDKEKALNVLTNILGGVKQFNFHSDHHGNPNIPTSGCGHMKMLTLNPKSYHLEKDQIDFINRTLTNIKKQGAKETILEGDHQEGAALTIKGQYGIFPRFTLETEGDDIETQAFVFHSTLVNERHRLVAKKLIEKRAVKLFPGTDEEYLYQVLSETTETHLFETLRKLALGLPIFLVEFDERGDFEISEMGKVV